MRTLNAKQKEGEMYLELVCDYFDIPVSKVISKSRKVPYPECRQLASYFITKLHRNMSQKAVVAPPVENEFFNFYSDVVFEQTARGIFSDQLKPAA
jgi:hypothetical protein